MRVLVAIGRTGGHIFPGLSLAEELKERLGEVELLFVGTGDRLEKQIFKDLPYQLETIPIAPMPYRVSLRWVRFFLRLTGGFGRSWSVLKKTEPDVVVGFGGAASGPLLLVAALKKIPTLIHEQNLHPGRSNRILSRFVTRVAISFSESRKYFKRDDLILTGNPVRAEILAKSRSDSLKRLGLTDGRFTVLILGGSQGSRRLNEVVVDAFAQMDEEVLSRIQAIHLTGVDNYRMVRDRYEGLNVGRALFPFLSEMGDAYGSSDLVVARAGATTIAEITSLGLPAILVPYPHARGHQRANARALGDAGGAVLVEENKLSVTRLKGLLVDLMEDEARLKRMAANSKRLGRPDATQRLAEEVIGLVKDVRG